MYTISKLHVTCTAIMHLLIYVEYVYVEQGFL